MAKNIGTLGKYDQRRPWKLICIVNPFDLLFKKKYKFNRFWMKEWCLISGQVFRNLIRHYRRQIEVSKSIEWRGAVNCGQCVLDIFFYFIMISPPTHTHLKVLSSNERLDFCDLKKKKKKIKFHDFGGLIISLKLRIRVTFYLIRASLA